jgi:hypothetical protein
MSEPEYCRYRLATINNCWRRSSFANKMYVYFGTICRIYVYFVKNTTWNCWFYNGISKYRDHRQKRLYTIQGIRQTRKAAMYVSRNIEARSFNHCSSGKAIIITYSECVFVSLGTQHEMRMRRIVICALPPCTIFSHIISQTVRFLQKKRLPITKCVLIFCTTFVWNISHSNKKWGRYDKKCILVCCM